VLALLPFDPRQLVVDAGEPAVDGPAELRLAPSLAAKTRSEISRSNRSLSSESDRSWFSSRRP